MDTREKIKLRQMIWVEYQAETDIEQAVINVRKKLPSYNVSESIVDYWYKSFNPYENHFLEPDNEEYDILLVVRTLSNGVENKFDDSLLLVYDNDSKISSIITADGRFALVLHHSTTTTLKVVFYDLFHGEINETTVRFDNRYRYICSKKMLNEHYLLLESFSKFLLLKFDYDSCEVKVVSTTYLYFESPRIIVDQLNQNNFLIYSHNKFATSSVICNEIVISPCQTLDLDGLVYSKLAGNILSGLRLLNRQNDTEDWKLEYSEINLTTLDKKIKEVCYALNDYRFYLNDELYCWHESRLYFLLEDTSSRYDIFVFNADTLLLTNIGIKVYGVIRSIFVNKEDVLTIEAQSLITESYKRAVYRFALKKPESLKNLVWFSIRRYAILFDGKIYKSVCNCFPMLMP